MCQAALEYPAGPPQVSTEKLMVRLVYRQGTIADLAQACHARRDIGDGPSGSSPRTCRRGAIAWRQTPAGDVTPHSATDRVWEVRWMKRAILCGTEPSGSQR